MLNTFRLNIGSTRKKMQQNKKLLSQVENFDQDVIVGDVGSSGRQIVEVSIGPADQEFNVNFSVSNPTTNENPVNVQTFERCLIDWIDRETVNIVETVEERSQNDVLTTIQYFICPRN